jgi:hypothetical protein
MVVFDAVKAAEGWVMVTVVVVEHPLASFTPMVLRPAVRATRRLSVLPADP